MYKLILMSLVFLFFSCKKREIIQPNIKIVFTNGLDNPREFKSSIKTFFEPAMLCGDSTRILPAIKIARLDNVEEEVLLIDEMEKIHGREDENINVINRHIDKSLEVMNFEKSNLTKFSISHHDVNILYKEFILNSPEYLRYTVNNDGALLDSFFLQDENNFIGNVKEVVQHVNNIYCESPFKKIVIFYRPKKTKRYKVPKPDISNNIQIKEDNEEFIGIGTVITKQDPLIYRSHPSRNSKYYVGKLPIGFKFKVVEEGKRDFIIQDTRTGERVKGRWIKIQLDHNSNHYWVWGNYISIDYYE